MYEDFIGTMPVAEKQRFDVGALENYLKQHIEGFKGPLGVEQFKGGQSNPTYRLTAGGRHYAMRAKPGPAAKLLPSAHAVDREFRVITALGKVGIPVPKTYCLCEDESVIGRAFYVMDCVEGRVLWQQSLPGLANAERAAIFDEMNRVIAALHQVDFASIGLSDYGRPGNYFERQINRWTKQYRASETEKIDARRLSHGQPDFSCDRTENPRYSGLGAVHARPSTRGFFLSLHELAYSGSAVSRHRWHRSQGARHPDRGGIRRRVLQAHGAQRHRQLEFLSRL